MTTWTRWLTVSPTFSRAVVGFVVLAWGTLGQAAEPPITALAFDPAESQLLLGSQRGVRRYAWPSFVARNPIETKLKQIHDIAFSPDGQMLALAGGIPGDEGIIEFWDWPSARQSRSFSVHSDLIYKFAWSADSKSVFTSSHDGDILQLSATSGKVAQTFSGHSQPVRTVGLLNGRRMLVSAGNDQTIRVWDIPSGKLLRSLNNHTKAIRDLAVRPKPEQDQSTLPMIATIAEDRTLRLWQPTIGRMVRFKRFSGSEPLSLAWSRDGRVIFVAKSDGNLIKIDPETLEIVTEKKTKVAQPISLIVAKNGESAVVAGRRGKYQVVVMKKQK